MGADDRDRKLDETILFLPSLSASSCLNAVDFVFAFSDFVKSVLCFTAGSGRPKMMSKAIAIFNRFVARWTKKRDDKTAAHSERSETMTGTTTKSFERGQREQCMLERLKSVLKLLFSSDPPVLYTAAHAIRYREYDTYKRPLMRGPPHSFGPPCRSIKWNAVRGGWNQDKRRKRNVMNGTWVEVLKKVKLRENAETIVK